MLPTDNLNDAELIKARPHDLGQAKIIRYCQVYLLK